MIRHVMFDFDGTIADTSEGIIRSMHYAYDKMDIPREKEEIIRETIGPPLEEMFRLLLHTSDEAVINHAVKYFRERYSSEGVRELHMYPDVHEVLEGLYRTGKKMYIVTSKPEAFVYDICKEYGIIDYFTEITGVALSGNKLSKAERMGKLMQKYGITSNNGVMVGDRPEDAKAAAYNCVECIGVLYGFGRKNELENAGCIRLIHRVPDLLQAIDEIIKCIGKETEVSL